MKNILIMQQWQAWHTKHNQQCTHITQSFRSGIPGQATNKKLSMDRICTGNTLNLVCNWRILGTSLCLNMQANTHAPRQSHSIQSGRKPLMSFLPQVSPKCNIKKAPQLALKRNTPSKNIQVSLRTTHYQAKYIKGFRSFTLEMLRKISEEFIIVVSVVGWP